MCGRYSLKKNPAELLREYFPGIHFDPSFQFTPSGDIRPGDYCPAILSNRSGAFCALLRWGLVPSWANDISPKIIPHNARAETLSVKPTFHASFRRKRCLIPADSFYEWQKTQGAEKRVPFRFYGPEAPLLLLAGIWDVYEGPRGVLQSFAIVTTAANESILDVHNRMPVILNREASSRWLQSGENTDQYHPFFKTQAQPKLEREAVDSNMFLPR